MSNYIPELETQTDQDVPTPWTNCNPASHAMLLDQWSWGAIDTSDVALRTASGVDRRRGMNFPECALAIGRLFGLTLLYSDVNAPGNGNTPATWAQLREHLRLNGSAVVCGNYSSLIGWTNTKGQALNRWSPGGSFGHAVHVVDYLPADESVFWQDPLGRGDYQGDRIPLAALWTFIWKEGNDENAIVTAAVTMEETRPEKPLTTRLARLRAMAIRLRKEKPAAYDRWIERTGLTAADDGKILRATMRLSAEVSHLREAPDE